MTTAFKDTGAATTVRVPSAQHSEDQLIEKLVERLPRRARAATHWLRRPSSRWARIPASVLLVGGGFAGILPLFGFWMLPLGLLLLAEDVPPLRRGRDRILGRIQRQRPQWFVSRAAASQAPAQPST